MGSSSILAENEHLGSNKAKREPNYPYVLELWHQHILFEQNYIQKERSHICPGFFLRPCLSLTYDRDFSGAVAYCNLL